MSVETHRNGSRRFTVLFITVLVCGLSALAIVRVPGPVVDHLLQHEIERRAVLWRDAVDNVLTNGERTFNIGAVPQKDEAYLDLITAASDIYRFKMLDARGRIFWSTRRGEVGEITPDTHFFEIVSKGVPFYKTASRPPAEVDGSEGVQAGARFARRDVAEVYMPMSFDGRFGGAIKFYTDVTEARAAYISRFRLALGMVSTGAAIAILSVVALLRRNSSLRIRQMRESAEAERRLMAEQVRLSSEVRLLGDLNEWLQSARSLDELFQMVARFLSHLLPGVGGSLYVYSHSRDILEGCASWNGAAVHAHIHPEECWGLRRGRTYSYGFADVEFVCGHAERDDVHPYACFPILAHGETVGLLHIRARVAQPKETFDEIRDLAQMCAEQISMAIANVRMRDQLHEQAIRDPLTGLHNRRHLLDRLRALIGRAAMTHGHLAVVSIDVDHFKKFNDNHGHDAGDMVLRAVGTALSQAVDGDELACRTGGEEFMLLLPDLAPADAMTRLEAIRSDVEAIRVRYGDKTLPRITISIGWAAFPHHGRNPQDLIRSSDDALYRAKAQGRNCIVEASAPQREAAFDAEFGRLDAGSPRSMLLRREPPGASRPAAPARAAASEAHAEDSAGPATQDRPAAGPSASVPGAAPPALSA